MVVIGLVVYANVVSLREFKIVSDVCIIANDPLGGVNSSISVVGFCDTTTTEVTADAAAGDVSATTAGGNCGGVSRIASGVGDSSNKLLPLISSSNDSAAVSLGGVISVIAAPETYENHMGWMNNIIL